MAKVQKKKNKFVNKDNLVCEGGLNECFMNKS